jgi:TonB family protein
VKKTEAHPARDLGFLSRLHDGELASDERSLFERHRDECPACGAAADEFEAALELYRSSQDAEPDAGLPVRLARSIDARISQPKPSVWIPTKLDLVWASVVIVCLAGAILVYGVARTRESRQLAADSLPIRIESERLARNKAASEAPSATAPPASAPKTVIAGNDVPRRPLAGRRETASQPSVTAESYAPEPAEKVAEKKLEKNMATADRADSAVAPESSRRAQAALPPAPTATGLAAPRAGEQSKLASSPAEGAAGYAAPAAPLRVGPGITPPTVRKRVEPLVEGRRGGAHRSVVAEIVVDENGDVGAVRIVRSDDPALDSSVAVALRGWKFHPAMRDGAPVSVYLDIEVRVDPR